MSTAGLYVWWLLPWMLCWIDLGCSLHRGPDTPCNVQRPIIQQSTCDTCKWDLMSCYSQYMQFCVEQCIHVCSMCLLGDLKESRQWSQWLCRTGWWVETFLFSTLIFGYFSVIFWVRWLIMLSCAWFDSNRHLNCQTSKGSRIAAAGIC